MARINEQRQRVPGQACTTIKRMISLVVALKQTVENHG